MIKATELRKNNLVLRDGKIVPVGWNILGFEFVTDEPIPLTPEIMERCGFEKVNEFFSIRIDEYIWFHIYEGGIYGFWSDSVENENNFTLRSQDNRIEYLHQLQNLILALTGEELEIKELQHA